VAIATLYVLCAETILEIDECGGGGGLRMKWIEEGVGAEDVKVRGKVPRMEIYGTPDTSWKTEERFACRNPPLQNIYVR
jgi:hypothetical protein